MPVPAFAQKIAMSAMPMPQDLQRKGKIPIYLCLQKSQKYRAYHRILVKIFAHTQKFPNGQMPHVPMPSNFEKYKFPFAHAQKISAC